MINMEICCLKSKTSTHGKVIPLHNTSEVTIGRSPDVTICIPSPMISRKHSILLLGKDGWTIQDNKSLNGTFVNSKKLDPHQKCLLKEGDAVQLGVSESPDKPAQFVWKFYSHLRVKKFKGSKAACNTGCNEVEEVGDPAPGDAAQSSIIADSTNRCLKRLRDENAPLAALPETDQPTSSKRLCDVPSPNWSGQQVSAEESKMQEKLRQQEEQLLAMQRQLQAHTTAQEQLQQELKEKEKLMQEKLQEQKEELDFERRRIEQEVKKSYEEQLRDREEALLSRLALERDELMTERVRLEESLQQDLNNLTEKERKLQGELLQERERLDKVIQKKEMERNLLQSELTQTRSENLQHKDDMLKARENLLTNFADLMETELQCSICNELFIQASSLNCAHSFCAMCIEEWLKVKKECPVCRSPVTSHLRSIVLDSYIDKMVSQLSQDVQQSRKELVKERKAAMEAKKAEARKAAACVTAPRGRRASRRGGRTRGNRGRGRGRGPVAPDHPTQPSTSTTTIVIASSPMRSVDSTSSDESSGSDISDSSVEGVPGSYYGGWGSCFNCGHRGHWAPGCPF